MTKKGERKGSSGKVQTTATEGRAFVSTDNPKIGARFRRLVRSKWFLLAILLVLISTAGLFYVYDRHNSKTTEQAAPPADPNDELAYRKYLLTTKGYKVTYADYLIIGNEYVARKDYKNAEAAYREAAALDRNNLDVKYALATIYRLRGDKDASLAYYDQLIADTSDENSPYHPSLPQYEAEREAVSRGNLKLENVEYPSELAL